ncbi:MAG: hypothetical protein H0V68_00310 [Actinobacteria bacterium]|nr:hypothetical protein [Actinomycetota bacterium]
MDPWHDYLAVPVAPLVLVAQVVGLFLPARAGFRAVLLFAAPVLIAGMLAYVSTRPVGADEGINIGQGVLVLWLLASLSISLLALVAESMRATAAKRRRRT